jgi:hypothetical protein
MILAAMFLIYKVKLVDNFNITSTTPMFTALKLNPINQNLFFWTMFLTSFFTIIGIVISSIIYKKMGQKQGLYGLPGERGEKGDIGDIIFKDSYKDICYYKLIEYSNAVMEKYKDDSNPVIEYPPNTDHLNNLLFKEQLKRICYSKEFEEALELNGVDKTNKKDLDNYLETYLKGSVKTWVSKILEYKKGLFFLSDHFANIEDIQLYLKVEKELGCRWPKNRALTIKDVEKKFINESEPHYWNWGKCME